MTTTRKTRKRKADADDDLALTIATGLATLVVDKKFRIDEADDVQEAFAHIIAAVEAYRNHAKRISILEEKLEVLEAKATPPKLKAVS